MSELIPTSTHWGNYLIEVDGNAIRAVHPSPEDPHPTPMGQSLKDALDSRCRVPRPMIRKGYLAKREKRVGRRRGCESFVAVPCEEALDIAAQAIERVRRDFGNEAIYGGRMAGPAPAAFTMPTARCIDS